MQIFLLKTTNGDEIIGEGTSNANGDLLLSKARIIRMMPQGPQNYGLALLPMFVSDPDGNCVVFNSTIGAVVNVVPDRLVKAYKQQTSPIEIATAIPGQM